MFEPFTYVVIAVAFFVGGLVKGTIGLGLPSISLGLLTATIGLQPAIALMIVPSFVTNIWQAVVGGNARLLLARVWPFLVAATATVWLGVLALTRVDVDLLAGLLGTVLVIYAVSGLARARMRIPDGWEGWVATVAGGLNGLVTGMTGASVMPGVMYLQAIGLTRDVLVQALGIHFTVSTVALAVALGERRLLSVELGAVSTAAVLPALAGMAAGQVLRRRITPARFQILFFSSLLVLGAYITFRSLARLA